MSTLIGNICLVLAALLTRALISSVYNYKPPHGGSGGADAYPIWILLIHLGFLALMSIACIAIARKGGFDWISTNKFFRYLLVAAGLLLAVLAMIFSSLMQQSSGQVPALIQFLARFAPAGIPVILVASGFILLHSFLRDLVPAICYQAPLALVFGVGILFIGAAVFEQVVSGNENIDKRYESKESIKAGRLREIEASDLSTDMVRILEFTGPIYPPEVREKASAKIKSYSGWQNELIALLEQEQAMAVFNFLASNEVDDKKRFLQPVNTGVLYAAYRVRHTIQGTSPSGFSRDMFSDEVETVLRTVEKFEGMGVDYRPALHELRAALDEPVGGKKIKLDCRSRLDEWLARRH